MVNCGNSEQKHDGLTISIEGSVNLQMSKKTTGVFEAFYNSVNKVGRLPIVDECCLIF